MKENRYDDDVFFEKYSQMSRSEKGLAGAGEWPVLKTMLPDFAGKRVLDLGCGYGWHCRYAADHGAVSALGLDLSEKMLKRARELNPDPKVEYRCCALEDYNYPAAEFDIVLSSLTFHYIEDLDSLFQRIAKTLKPVGEFIFSMEHPVFTAEGSQQWLTEEEIWPVSQYFIDGRREAVFLGEPVVKFHHSLTTLVQALLNAGFELLDIQEPMPSDEMLREQPKMREEMQRPMMIIFKAKKRS